MVLRSNPSQAPYQVPDVNYADAPCPPGRRPRYKPETPPLLPYDFEQDDPVLTAVYYGSPNMLQRALTNTPEPEYVNAITTERALPTDDGERLTTPLHEACRSSDTTACGLMLLDLLKHKPRYYNTALATTKETPLMIAAQYNNLPMVYALLAILPKAALTSKNNTKKTARQLSTNAAIIEIIAAAEESADFQAAQHHYATANAQREPTIAADSWRNHPVAKFFCSDEQNAWINHPLARFFSAYNFDDLTPLNWRRDEPLTELVARGTDPNEMQKLLLAGISPTDGKTRDGSPLFIACCNDDTNTALLLLQAEQRLAPRQQSYNRRFNVYHLPELAIRDNPHTCLMVATAYNNVALAQALIAAGASLDSTNSKGEKVLDIAKRLGRYEIIQILSTIKATIAAQQDAAAAAEETAAGPAPSLLKRSQGGFARIFPWNW